MYSNDVLCCRVRISDTYRLGTTIALLLLESRTSYKELGMEKNTIVDRLVIRGEEVTKEGFIPFLGGRPKRLTIINRDDIVNLSIALNTTDSVDSYLAQL